MVLSSKTNANGNMDLELDDVPTVGQTEDDLDGDRFKESEVNHWF